MKTELKKDPIVCKFSVFLSSASQIKSTESNFHTVKVQTFLQKLKKEMTHTRRQTHELKIAVMSD